MINHDYISCLPTLAHMSALTDGSVFGYVVYLSILSKVQSGVCMAVCRRRQFYEMQYAYAPTPVVLLYTVGESS